MEREGCLQPPNRNLCKCNREREKQRERERESKRKRERERWFWYLSHLLWDYEEAPNPLSWLECVYRIEGKADFTGPFPLIGPLKLPAFVKHVAYMPV